MVDIWKTWLVDLKSSIESIVYSSTYQSQSDQSFRALCTHVVQGIILLSEESVGFGEPGFTSDSQATVPLNSLFTMT